ncbi:MAG TPA: lasso RiPP family leader peptide-containing protein [Solirubrobacteraceae bacterium]|nr:lasso RiPP family leader peptide-containing protein [Solirubrobacteraceae bacterium]
MEANETFIVKEIVATRTSDRYEPPTLVKHGSFSELTLGSTMVSGGGGGPWHHKKHTWG